MSEVGKTKKKRGWGRVVLITSLALNLAFVGALAGAAWRYGGDRNKARASDFSVPYIRALSPEDRRAIGKELRAVHNHSKSGKAARGALFKQMSEALRAEPFDLVRVEELSLQQRAAVGDRLTAAQDIWLQYVADMSNEERIAYADRLDEAIARGPHRKNKK